MTEQRTTIIKCPGCGAELTWDQRNPWRPFCSERCKNLDFVAWANQELKISSGSLYDDMMSDDVNGSP